MTKKTLTKYLKRLSKKPQKLDIWLNKAVAKVGARPVLTYIHKTNEYVESADGYRIHRSIENNDYLIGVNPTKTSVKKECGDLKLDNPFPDTDSVFPKRYDTVFIIGTRELINAVQAALVSAKHSANSVNFSVIFNGLGYELGVYGKSADFGDTETMVDIKLDRGKTCNFSLNGQFVLDAVNGMKNHDTITVKSNVSMVNFSVENREALIMAMIK